LTGEQWKKIIGNTISIAMWIYTRDDGSYSAGTPFFGMGGMTAPNNRKFSMFHYDTKTNLHCSWQNDNSNSTYWSCHYSNFFELNKWVHLCIVQDAATNTVTVYRNGVQYSRSTVNGLSSMNFNEAGTAPIRANIDYQHMNDLRIYDHALSIKEIRELSKALMIHYTFNDAYAEPVNNIDSNKTAMIDKTIYGASGLSTDNSSVGVYSFGNFYGFDCFKIRLYKESITAWTGVYMNINPLSYGAVVGDTVVRSCWMYVPSGQTKPGHFNESIEGTASNKTYKQYDFNRCNTWQRIWMKGTLTASTGTNNFLHYFMAMTSGSVDFTFYVRDFQMEINDHPTAYTPGIRTAYLENEAGYNINTTVSKLYLSEETNSGSYACKFSGNSSELIQIPLDLTGKTDLTIAAWVKPNGSGTIGSKAVYHVINSSSFDVYAYGRSNNWLKTTITQNAWNHIVVTYSANTRKIYVNGVEKISDTISGTFTGAALLDLGYDTSTNGRALNGLVSDYRIYSTALSAADVLELYEGKASVDKTHNIFTNEIIEQNEVANMVNLGSWEQGGVQDASGTDANNMNNRARTKYIPVLPNTSYYFQAAAGWDIRGVHFYRKDNTWISYSTIGSAGVRTTPADCYYVRFVVQSDSASANVLIANIATFGPVMVPGDTATTSGMATDTDVQVTKTYQIKTKDICENHDAGFFRDGTASGNRFHEI
jgi:hypothetical protein